MASVGIIIKVNTAFNANRDTMLCSLYPVSYFFLFLYVHQSDSSQKIYNLPEMPMKLLSFETASKSVYYHPGPDCSKLTTSLVNVSIKFQMLLFQIHQYFLLKKCKKLLHCKCKSFSHFFQQKYQYIWL